MSLDKLFLIVVIQYSPAYTGHISSCELPASTTAYGPRNTLIVAGSIFSKLGHDGGVRVSWNNRKGAGVGVD